MATDDELKVVYKFYPDKYDGPPYGYTYQSVEGVVASLQEEMLQATIESDAAGRVIPCDWRLRAKFQGLTCDDTELTEKIVRAVTDFFEAQDRTGHTRFPVLEVPLRRRTHHCRRRQFQG